MDVIYFLLIMKNNGNLANGDEFAVLTEAASNFGWFGFTKPFTFHQN